jgi:hypothetical protein
MRVRRAAGADASSAAIARCAGVALRLVLDDLIAMCESDVDGDDRVLLCDAALWLDTLSAAPEAWRAEP